MEKSMEAYSSEVHGTRGHTPVHNLSPGDVVGKGERSVYPHFHAPFNSHNRFQETSTESELFFLRDFDRLAPFKSDDELCFGEHSTERPETTRPVSAPAVDGTAESYAPGSPRKAHVPPNDRSAALYYANIVDGQDIALVGNGHNVKRDPEWNREQWKLAQVVSYQVPEPQRDNRPKPFYQDYRHYKYYGFAGQGAKTSWAHNPKQTLISEYAPLETFGKQVHTVTMPPLSLHLDGPRRPLSTLECKLMGSFPGHGLGMGHRMTIHSHSESAKTVQEARWAEGPTPRARTKYQPVLPPRPAGTQQAVCLRVNLQPDKTGPMQRNRELLSGPDHDRTPPTQRLADPSRKKGSATEHAAAQSDQSGDHSRFYTTVLDRHATKQLRMPKTDGTSQSYRVATVATYKEPHPHPTWVLGRGAPAHGSQAPFHQRYAHYKYHGYGGGGAKTSWARNPKIQLLYDLNP